MAFVVKFAKNVRNHWKKSLFAATLVSYGVSYGIDKLKINNLMKNYCEEASTYGAVLGKSPQRVIVLVNPAANRRSAEETFKKYCEPILHLAGYLVDIVKTDSEGHARRYIEELQQFPSAIVVAGGDGTVSEVVTGLLRKSEDTCPIGVLPVGRMNASSTGRTGNRVEEAQQLAEAAISIVRGNVAKKHVMKIEVITDQDEEHRRPVYAVGSFQWGAFRDILCLRDHYWYTGPLREYMAFLVNSFRSHPTWECSATITYTPPCSGCNNCRTVEKKATASNGRWWSAFSPRPENVPDKNFTHVVNEVCANVNKIDGKHSEITVGPATESGLHMVLSPLETSAFTFIRKSWKRLQNGTDNPQEAIEARTVQILPELKEDKYYSIDNEEYDVKPIKITLIPHAIKMFSTNV
uniref:Acylglycerol kinase, mitochondrial n=1 Tax=Nyssomyia neivai TaxID=330878 RepID=A0A1L8DZ26_9DIPT